MQKIFKHAQRGQLLIESLIAISIIVVGLLGIFALLSQSLALRRVASERYVGTYLAAEGIEIVKNIIDQNIIRGLPWNQGLSAGTYELDSDDYVLQTNQGRQLLYDPATGLYNYLSGDQTIFRRTVTISYPGGADEIRINAVTDWITRGQAQFSVNLEDHFYNWR